MHNTGFQSLHLPYTYSVIDTQSIEEVQTYLNDPLFGGASVTIPLKVFIFKYNEKKTKKQKNKKQKQKQKHEIQFQFQI